MGDTEVAAQAYAAGPDRARLFEIASEQGGYSTAEQARAFLDPILGRSIPDDARWDPARRTW